MEVLYLSEAKKVEVNLLELINYVASSINYQIVPVNADIVLTAIRVDDVPELHDRIIAATAMWLNVPIITSDRVISQSKYVEAIW